MSTHVRSTLSKNSLTIPTEVKFVTKSEIGDLHNLIKTTDAKFKFYDNLDD